MVEDGEGGGARVEEGGGGCAFCAFEWVRVGGWWGGGVLRGGGSFGAFLGCWGGDFCWGFCWGLGWCWGEVWAVGVGPFGLGLWAAGVAGVRLARNSFLRGFRSV